MPIKHTCRIVDFAIDDNPAVIFFFVPFNLLTRKLLLRGCCLVLDILDAVLSRGGLHPAPSPCARLAGMSEVQHRAAIVVVVNLCRTMHDD